METLKHIVNTDAILFRYLRCPCEIPKVHQQANSDEEILGNSICDDCHEVTLDVTMFLTSDLLQLGYTLAKPLEACVWVEDGESVVDFGTFESADAPFHIVVPEHFVPVVKGFWCQEF